MIKLWIKTLAEIQGEAAARRRSVARRRVVPGLGRVVVQAELGGVALEPGPGARGVVEVDREPRLVVRGARAGDARRVLPVAVPQHRLLGVGAVAFVDAQ